MNSIFIPPAGLPPMINDVKQWDLLLTYQTASQAPGSLAQKVALARAAGFDFPANMPQPWTAKGDWAQKEVLAQFNAVVDALGRFADQPGKSRIQPRDIVVNDVFAFQAPKQGYFVRFSAAGVAQEIAVYRR